MRAVNPLRQHLSAPNTACAPQISLFLKFSFCFGGGRILALPQRLHLPQRQKRRSSEIQAAVCFLSRSEAKAQGRRMQLHTQDSAANQSVD